ncbi:MAG: hypothetical protein ACREBE_25610, partial [bacterium]
MAWRAALLVFAPIMAMAQSSSFVRLDSSAGISALETRLSARFDLVDLRGVVAEIARLASLRLTFDPELPGLARRVTLTLTNVTARTALQRALDGSAIQALVSPSGLLVLAPLVRAGDRDATVLRGVAHTPEHTPLGGVRVDLVGTRFSAY